MVQPGRLRPARAGWWLALLAVLSAVLSAALSLAAPAAAQPRREPLLHSALGASSGWRIEGGFRARLEAIDGQFRPAAAEHDIAVTLRTTLLAEYDSGPVRIGAELFDARAYFQRPGSSVGTAEVNALELAQAYIGVDMGSALGDATTSSLTGGRMTLDIGSRRLVARNAFRNSTNAFTGVRFNWTDAARDRLVLFWLLPHSRLPDDAAGIAANGVVVDRESLAVQFFGGSFTRAQVFGGSLEVYGYGLLERDARGFATRNRRLFTPGLRLFRAPAAAAFDWDIEASYQLGTARATASPGDLGDLKVRAYFAHLELGRTWALPWAPRLALQYVRASGDGGGAGRFGRFDTLFGARRFDYGPTGLFGPFARTNLSLVGARLDVVPAPRWDGLFAWRAAWLESASDSFSGTGVRDRRGASGSFGGHQLEARARYWIIPEVLRAEIGGAVLFKGDFLRRAPNGRDNGDSTYGYCDLNWSF